jgi:uncharacterized membrane protein YgcG
MKSFLPILSLLLVVSSCSTAYKSGQTPDDVYFSPTRPQEEYVRVERDDDRRYRSEERVNDDRAGGSDYYNYDDRSLRMKVRNRNRWNDMDYDSYSYNPYYRNYNSYYYNSPWNSYSYWNYYYNPYASRVIILNPKTAAYNRPRTTNLRVFDNTQDPKVNANDTRYRTGSTYNNSNNTNRSRSTAPRRNVGNDLRTIFGSDNNSTSTPRSSTPSEPKSSTNSSNNSSSSGSSGSSSGSSGGSAPARRF